MSRRLCHSAVVQPCPDHLRKYVLAVAVLGSSLGFIDGTIITVAAQPIRASLGATFAEIQWVVNAYTLALSAFLLVGGAAGDRYGKRRVFAVGIVLFAAASVACGLAPSVETIAGRGEPRRERTLEEARVHAALDARRHEVPIIEAHTVVHGQSTSTVSPS